MRAALSSPGKFAMAFAFRLKNGSLSTLTMIVNDSGTATLAINSRADLYVAAASDDATALAALTAFGSGCSTGGGAGWGSGTGWAMTTFAIFESSGGAFGLD